MPYANLEDQKAHARRYYQLNKDTKWKNADGSWKLTNHKERRRAAARKYVYTKLGRTDLTIDEILLNLHGPCPICGEETDLVYDHCHKTGQFREWICNACNLILGYAQDNPNRLLEAAAYLERHQ